MSVEFNAAKSLSATPSIYRLHLELSKARLSLLVLTTTFVGFILGSPDVLFQLPALFWTLIGTGFAAAGANALNQWFEVNRDAKMIRTRNRPLPSGNMSPQYAFGFGIAASILGTLILSLYVNDIAAGLALLNVLLYVLVYTPMKPLSTMNTLVGAICGAVPPMIGWAGAAGGLGAGAWLLGAILFAWQIPHFMALAWLYRDDYERGGFRMLPIVDQSGGLTCRVIVLYLVAMIPLALILTLFGYTGIIYAIGSVILGAYFLWQGLILMQTKNNANARKLFLASLIYLPFLLGLMVIDKSEQPEQIMHTLTQANDAVQEVSLHPLFPRY